MLFKAPSSQPLSAEKKMNNQIEPQHVKWTFRSIYLYLLEVLEVLVLLVLLAEKKHHHGL